MACDGVARREEIDAALGRGAHLFGELDQLFNHFLRRDGSVVIGVQRFLQPLKARPLLRIRYGTKLAALDEAAGKSEGRMMN